MRREVLYWGKKGRCFGNVIEKEEEGWDVKEVRLVLRVERVLLVSEDKHHVADNKVFIST